MRSSSVSLLLLLIVLCEAFPTENGVETESQQRDKDHKENGWQKSGQFEGDMILNEDQKERWHRQERNGMTDTRYRWPKGELVYEFDQSISANHRKQIEDAISEFRSRSCVRLRRKGQQDADYVYIKTTRGEGCFSMIGRQGGSQKFNLELDPNVACWDRGTIQHEFLHAFGFYHMHSDPSRDQYVQIQWANIDENDHFNFRINKGTTMFGYKYDYGSVMHYNRYSFSKNGKPTIVTVDPNANIGQTRGMSDVDVKKLNAMYGCK